MFWQKQSFVVCRSLTSEAATSVSEALPADADSASACGGNARTALPKWRLLARPMRWNFLSLLFLPTPILSPPSALENPRPGTFGMNHRALVIWSYSCFFFPQYSAALKESCSVMRHEPYYTNPRSCAKFSLIRSFFPFNSASNWSCSDLSHRLWLMIRLAWLSNCARFTLAMCCAKFSR